MSFWTYWAGVDDDIAAGDNATNQLKALNLRRYQEGKITLEQYNSSNARLDGNLADSAAAGQQIQDAFVEGANDGLNNIANTVQSATSGVLGGFWKVIPWQVKVLAALVAAWYGYQFFKTAKALA